MADTELVHALQNRQNGGSAASDGPRWAGGMAAGGTHPDPVGLPDREPAQNWQKSGSGRPGTRSPSPPRRAPGPMR